MEEESDDKDDTKRKSRNLSEKKRRDQFNILVNDLSALISTSNRKMDKSTVLKSTIAFLKHHNEATDRSKVFEIQQDWKPTFLSNDEFTHLMLESLDGFIVVFSSTGSIFYASESITSLLGYLPNDLLNMNIFDLAYETDHESLLNIFLNPKPVIEPLQTDINSDNQISFHVHLRRGGIEQEDANAYELIKFVGYFRNDANLENTPFQNTQPVPKIFQLNPAADVDKKLIFVGTGRIQTPQLMRDMSAIDPTCNEFTSKQSMEWKFLFLDHRAPPIIGYMPFEVLGTSGYDYYHFDDLDSIVTCHEELMRKGEGKTCYYRFLTKGQQWIWLQTDFYISYHQFSAKPDYVVCNHKVVSYAEVIKQTKLNNKTSETPSINMTKPTKSSTVTLREIETSNQSMDTMEVSPSCSGKAMPSLQKDNSPTLEATTIWPGTSSSTGQLNKTLKTSRPSSSYGNISSAGISPIVKRKRYVSHHNRGNESDSTSMSADSVTSRHSLMTHLSSQHRHRHGHGHRASNQQEQQHTTQQQQCNLPSQQPGQLQQQKQQPQPAFQQLPSQPKMLPMLPQHALASTQMVATNACQFPQPAFPIHSPQIMAPTFIEPSQYLAAIPVQPVIAPFPVAPVLPPLSVSATAVLQTSTHSAISTLCRPLQSQSEMLPSNMVMTQTQTHLQEQLQRKHDELQKLIMQQQDELRLVSEQLLLARYTLLQPVMPVNYNSATSNSRSYGYSGNHMDTQFGQYAFPMQADQIQNNQEQQMLLQQQQQQQQQQLQQQQQQIQHQQHLQNQQQQQQQQQQQMQAQPQQLQQLTQSQQQQPQQQQQSILSRTVPDLDDIDAFLNLSPLQSIGSHSELNHIANHGNSNNTVNGNGAGNANSNNQQAHAINQQYTNNSIAHNDDSLLSYMQMATETSPTLNFSMGISDDGSETQSNDTKLLQRHLLHLPQQQQQSGGQSSYFSSNPFQTLNNQSGSNNQLPNDLEILPYQMSQEQSQNLFNSPHASGTS